MLLSQVLYCKTLGSQVHNNIFHFATVFFSNTTSCILKTTNIAILILFLSILTHRDLEANF